ncbi:SRPBCC family protein [Persicobacter sp. CCB-QB2]|uniref:SRPBCC family protein n=1 Tax=Persicobacter sp. CCB-QB2 TaxID=1561025 RepID=UPI0006A94AAC|nr:SRPBCC family protein [Persicobacter sp. CCB-QB2]
MRKAFSCEERFDLPKKHVWEFAIDFQNVPLWLKEVRTIEQIGENQFEVSIHSETGGEDYLSRFRVTDIDPEKAFTIESKSGGILVKYHYNFTSLNQKCKVRLDVCCEGKNAFWAALSPFMVWMIRSSDKRILQQLKKTLQTNEAPS